MSDLDRGNDELLWTSLNCIEPLKTVVLVAPQGFEPRYAAPEAAVLPLNEGAIRQGDFTILRAGPTLVNPTSLERWWADRMDGQAAAGETRKRSVRPSAAKAGPVLIIYVRG
jgi:hypothetical protein